MTKSEKDACDATSKDKPCPNYPLRKVSGYYVCRDHLNMLKDGEVVTLQNGEKLRLQ